MKKGYVLLLTVLSIGLITSTVAIVILLLGLSIERNAYSLQISTQAYEFSQSCAEEALQRLRNDLEYEGNEKITVGIGPDSSTTGECTVRPVVGYWNNNRTICTEAIYGNFTKRRQVIQVQTVLPDTRITDWVEVSHIDECPEYTEQTCGNGTIEGTEDCDDSGDSTTCNANCTYASCGDGYTNTSYISPSSGLPEQCDTEGESSTCNLDCTLSSCGDGTTNTLAGEDCDDAGESAACNTDCTDAVCGDGIINVTASETCDGNGAGVGGETATCDTDCTVRSCGDGVVNITAGEQCDGGPSCNGSCQTIIVSNPSNHIAYWRLDEASGNALSSSGSYTCTEFSGAAVSTNRPTPITGAPVTSTRTRDFDGSNDYLRCPTSAALSPSPITVSFWVISDVTPVLRDGILCATNNTWTRGWGFAYESASSIAFFIESWGSNFAVRTSVNPLVWNHVLGSWDGTTVRVYVNGIEGTSDTYYGSLDNTQTLNIGRCFGNTWNINGRVDDVRIFNRILTSAEITALATGT